MKIGEGLTGETVTPIIIVAIIIEPIIIIIMIDVTQMKNGERCRVPNKWQLLMRDARRVTHIIIIGSTIITIIILIIVIVVTIVAPMGGSMLPGT